MQIRLIMLPDTWHLIQIPMVSSPPTGPAEQNRAPTTPPLLENLTNDASV